MKKLVGIFLLLLLIFRCEPTFAQDARLDSLLQLFPAAKADTDAVLLYMDLGELYRSAGNLKTASGYHLKALTLSRKLNYLHGLFYSSDYYSFILKRQGLYDSAIAVNGEMLEVALKHADDYQAAISKAQKTVFLRGRLIWRVLKTLWEYSTNPSSNCAA
ncbi:MAG: hypothetical protein LBG96_00935 [Tannerella sp.]|jgi:tetratricopeptide (TPR) repeat protein|nr:hypothetical protein [Tannerella sp.]